MKKTLIVSLALSLIISVAPFTASAESGKSNTDITSTGITYLNMPAQTFGGETNESKINISDLVLGNKTVQISGCD